MDECRFAEQRARVRFEQRLPGGGKALGGIPEVFDAGISGAALCGLRGFGAVAIEHGLPDQKGAQVAIR